MHTEKVGGMLKLKYNISKETKLTVKIFGKKIRMF